MKFKRIARAVGFTVAVLTAITVTPGAAFAGDGPWVASKFSGCTKTWSYNVYGAQARAVIDYDAHRVSSQRYAIDYARSYVDSMWDCGPHGAAVRAYQITTQTEFQFRGAGLTCTLSGGIPRSVGVSCSSFSDGVTVNVSQTCGNNVLACTSTFGYFEVLAPPGASFYNYVFARTWIELKRSDGQTHRWSTPYV